MKKVAVVIDSTCYMSKEEVIKRGYKVIPLSVNFEDTIYKEYHDNGEKSSVVFDEIYKRKTLPKTSQPTPNDTIKVIQELVDEGYNKIISLHISEELSGTTQGVKIAATQYLEENNLDIELVVYSTKAAAQVSGIIANEIDDIVKNSGDISNEEIEAVIDYYRKTIEVFFFAEDLNFLHYGGRMPQALASTLKILGVSPVLTLNENGGIEKYKVERSQKKGLTSVLKNLAKESYTADDEIILMTAHIKAEKKAKKVLKMAQEATKGTLVQSEVSNLGIVIGNHLGPGAFGIGWCKKYKRK
ncbi:MAG: DegV family protein [Mycoplasmatales bacterium]